MVSKDGAPMETAEAVAALVAVLKGKRFCYNSERDLQDGMEDVFKAKGFQYERERELGPGDIVDFLLFGSVGVEVKIKGSPVEVARQLLRYAGRPEVAHIVLVTGKLSLGRLPEELLGKPVTVVALWRGFL
jgi:hypothetical protein